MSVIIIIGGGGGGGGQNVMAQSDDGQAVISGPDGSTIATFANAEDAAKYLAHLAKHPA